MYSIVRTSILLGSLSTIVLANIFRDGNGVLSESSYSKEIRIIGGTEVSFEFLSLHRCAHIICTCSSAAAAGADNASIDDLTQSLSHMNHHTTIKQAMDDRYPYLVSLKSGSDHVCGGSLIAKDTVLTAA
jgi:hypothetical protein